MSRVFCILGPQKKGVKKKDNENRKQQMEALGLR